MYLVSDDMLILYDSYQVQMFIQIRRKPPNPPVLRLVLVVGGHADSGLALARPHLRTLYRHLNLDGSLARILALTQQYPCLPFYLAHFVINEPLFFH